MVVTWIGSAGLVIAQPLLGLSPDLLTLAQFGPTIGMLAAVGLAAALRRPSTLTPATVSLTTVARRIVVGAAILTLLFFGYVEVATAIGHPVRVPNITAFGLLAVLQLAGACGEELGWRSFLQRHLRVRWPTLVSSVVVGVLWGSWHVQYYRFGFAFLATFVVTTVAVSVIFGVLTEGSGWWSLPIAGILHWLLNLGILLFADFQHGGQPTVTVLAVVSVVAAAITATVAHYRRAD
ncbi:CPBP family intramembrane glutamic endopeptidase [Fodinicola acaciae]|uniref:CPBP family intramembrane glutamic endopeptidase n=1 Tax=Fodinicola acaciae TaxID=2681555 RepID=UPI0013D10D81|nr:CPBP family intramembrane glutamic endopeptidase [Fodinicola acaciae]